MSTEETIKLMSICLEIALESLKYERKPINTTSVIEEAKNIFYWTVSPSRYSTLP